MNLKMAFLGTAGLIAGLIAACHNDYQSTPSTPPSTSTAATSQSLDTAQVLVLAQQTSETSSPIAVNGGALTLNDTSETSAAIAINAM